MAALSKKDLVSKLSLDTKLSAKDGSAILEFFLYKIKTNLINGNQKISKFGTFYKKVTPQRVGRNPKTKETYTIMKRNKISFKISSKIKNNLN